MSTIQEIQTAIRQLPRHELTAFRDWFTEFAAAAWDKELEQDVAAGRLAEWSSTMESCMPLLVARLGLAIGMFVTEEVTLGQAAEIAGISQAEMLKELGRRRIAIHYGPEELAEDLQTVAAFGT